MSEKTKLGLRDSELRREFEQCLFRWKRDTRFTSSATDLVNHEAYQRVIGMGPAVVPLLLREMRERPDHWFWALREITGADPTVEGDTFDQAVEHWLEWGKGWREGE